MEQRKQTAVEWLANQIAEIPHTYLTGKYGFIELSNVIDDKVYRINMDIIHLINEAKEMEEDQITFAWEDGFWEGCEEKLRDYSAQDYYKRTYGN